MSLITRPFMNMTPEQAGVEYQRNTNCSDAEREAYEKGFEDAKQHFGFNMLHELQRRQAGMIDRVLARMEYNQSILISNGVLDG